MSLVSAKNKRCLMMHLALALMLLLPATAVYSATYYHVTVKAFLDPHDNSAVEWAWVTLVEIPKSQVYPREAGIARNSGGSLRGSVLALVRADAWRSEHSSRIKKRCSGRPAEMVISWGESWGDRVYAQGGHDNPNNMDEINFGFTSRPIFREDGRRFDPKGQAYVVAGPASVAGSPSEEMKGSYLLRAVNFLDPLKHYEHCGRRWVKQYPSDIGHFHIHEEFLDGDNEIFGQKAYGPRDENNFVYQIIRSSSREHPHWRRQEM